ncbi:modification methylase [Pasteurellaceae bacterium LFhippo2]|nr:modification methylase [Pasteurellaceae bacterium LFhippo2]
MNYISFFSGALGLDLGLEKGGLKPLLFCENNKHCQATIKANKPEVPLIGDIREHDADSILQMLSNEKIDIVVGGPPCQAFSTAGARKSFEDERGNVFLHFLNVATDLAPKYIVIENVRGLLSATYSPSNEKSKKGSALEYVVNFLESKNYSVSFNLYNAANFGVPQIRERVVIIAVAHGEKVPYLEPTHEQSEQFGLDKWLTLKDAISDIPQEKNELCATFPEKRLKYYRLLSAGQNWRNLPLELQKEALGKSFELGGGKTGFLRRLDWNKPSPTLVTSPTMPATDLAHPVENRPLSVAEYARIQQFPDDWVFCGKIVDQYKQIGNAVPCGLGLAIATTLKKHNNSKPFKNLENFPYSRYKFTNERNWLQAFKH